MKTGLSHFNLSKHAFIAFLGAMLFFMAAEPALASNHIRRCARCLDGLDDQHPYFCYRTICIYFASIIGPGAGAMLIRR
ncbi:hypothetical protein [Enterobacter kobei]|uniref:hypothetical protein n=1 Tax=Enterobacter kobei TaxID=208224 RepID=UPI00388E2949